MPTTLFTALNSRKKELIEAAAIFEFAHYGYESSSTNRIVKNAGISKGSLFKYFQNKEELYFYILDCVMAELVSSVEKQVGILPSDPFEMIVKYAELEFAWYIQNPEKYRLIVKAFAKSDTGIFRATEARYSIAQQDIFDNLFENIDTGGFRWSKKKTVDILKWFLEGFNEEYVAKAGEEIALPIDKRKEEYVENLTDYMEILKAGLLKRK